VIQKFPSLGARPLAALLLCAAALGGSVAPASAAGEPAVDAAFVESVTATSVALHGRINPNGLATTYRFEYITEAAFQANLAASPPREGFSGAVRKPVTPAGVGAGTSDVPVSQQPSGLTPVTIYHYRLVATNSAGTAMSPDRKFGTEEPTNVVRVLDGRAYEMVSPVEKNGGAIQGFGGNFGGDVLQAAADGNAVTYSSADSFGAGPQGAPAGSQYLARRGGGGWASENITTPLLSGSYGDTPDGVPYQLFSTDLSRGLLSNGQRCRGSNGECPVANPPLPGTGAPAGYRDYYRRDNASGGFQSLLSGADLSGTTLGSGQFELAFAAATPDLGHVVLSSCARLTAAATEVAAAGGCDPAAQNLYEWSGSGLTLINLLPGDTQGTPGARMAARSGAISADGSRVYWTEGGSIYLREGTQTRLLGESAGGTFQTASVSGRFAFFVTAAGDLDRYDATSGTSSDLAPGAGVLGVLGASEDGTHVYYLSGSGLFLWNEGTTTKIAVAAAAGDYPPSTGAARVSPDGSHLAFVSTAELTGYENNGVTEVFLYGPPAAGGPAQLTCVSCNPTGERPQGPSSIPGALANGSGEGATRTYKPRALSSNGFRVFFDSSDVLAVGDTNQRPDVYEWEAAGSGDCGREGGCVALISSGRSAEPSTFIDASANGSDAFFLTEASLVPGDPGSFDLYDDHEAGGFAVPPTPIPCNGDACQALPEAPEDPTPGTLVPNAGNPALQFTKPTTKKKHHKHHHRKKHPHKGAKTAGGKHGGGR
jgi:WD40-like Beta Propeller Repeat